MWDYRASVLKVKDGDTLRVLLDRGFDETKEIDLRLFDTWAPEKKDSGGPETKSHAAEWVAERSEGRWPFVVILERNKSDTHEVSTLGRFVGTLLDAQGQSLNSAVTEFVGARGYGHGTGYEGGA